MNRLSEQLRLSIYGLAIGDAMGGAFQFNERERTLDVTSENIFEMMDIFNSYLEDSGYKRIKNGTWSDDTAMTLATMDGLSKIGHIPQKLEEYIPVIRCFLDWYQNGKYTQDGYAWDVGLTTDDALAEYLTQDDFYLTGPVEERKSGNGSLMRFAPVPFLLYSKYGINALEMKENCEFVYNMSAITHGSKKCEQYCLFYTAFMLCILEGVEKNNLLKKTRELINKSAGKYGTEERLFTDSFPQLPKDEVKSSGYVVASLEAAIWCFLNTDNLSDCIALCISLGDDTDSIAAIAGSFAGIFFGNLPQGWCETLRKTDILDDNIEIFKNTFLS